MKVITHRPSSTTSTVNWYSDLHLDKVDTRQINYFLQCIVESTADCVAITGDISSARCLTNHLRVIATVCMPRPVFFVTGNHDYYGGSFTEVDAEINALCEKVGNLHYLNGRQIIPLNRHTCLIGHNGWPDARAGYGIHSRLRSPDHRAIVDFRGLTREQSMIKMQELGKDSAKLIRQILPLALSRFFHVIVLTHTPPFAEAVRYNDAPCGPLHLPHYANVSVGLAIRGIASAFPTRRITILCGHSHSASVTQIGPNICVRVAHARTGRLGALEVLRLS